jgi:hypothetical protein
VRANDNRGNARTDDGQLSSSEADEGMNTSRGRRCRIRLTACEARPSLREPA